MCQSVLRHCQSYRTLAQHTHRYAQTQFDYSYSIIHACTHTHTRTHKNSVTHTQLCVTYTHTGTNMRLFVKDKIYRISTNDRHHLYPSPGDDVKNVHFIKWSQVLLVTTIPLHAPFFTFTEKSNNHDNLVKNKHTKNTHQQ